MHQFKLIFPLNAQVGEQMLDDHLYYLYVPFTLINHVQIDMKDFTAA